MSQLQNAELGLGYRESWEYLQRAVLTTLSYPNQDPSNGRLCCLSLVNAMGLLLVDPHKWPHPPKNAQPEEDRSKRYSPGFGNGLIQFTLSMTDSKLRKFQQQVSTCRCASYKPSSKDDGHRFALLQSDLHHMNAPGDLILLLCKALYLLIGIMLHIPGLGNVIDPTELPGDKQYTTPANLSKGVRFMTNKTADVVLASRCWFKHTKCPYAPFFLMVCLRRYREVFLPALRTTVSQDLLSLVTKELQRLLIDIEKRPPIIDTASADAFMYCIKYVREVVVHLRSPFQVTARPLLDAMHNTVVGILNAFDALSFSQQLLFVERGIIGPICHIGIGTIPENDNDFQKRLKLVQYFARFDTFGRETINSTLSMLDARNENQGVYLKVYSDIQLLRGVLECMNPHCGKMPKSHRFPKCARCGLVSYCSSQCQKLAWTLPECPHKKVCKALNRLDKCWPTANVLIQDGDDFPTQNKLLKKSAAHLGFSESMFGEIDENITVLQDMRSKRARDSKETNTREGDRLLLDGFDAVPSRIRF